MHAESQTFKPNPNQYSSWRLEYRRVGFSRRRIEELSFERRHRIQDSTKSEASTVVLSVNRKQPKPETKGLDFSVCLTE